MIDDTKKSVELACTQLLDALGLDLNNEHLQRTPERMAKMYVEETCVGLFTDRPIITTFKPPATAIHKHPQLQRIGPITLHSMCSHHFVPVIGTATIVIMQHAEDLTVGLSKWNRLVDWCARRPTSQEELGEMILSEIVRILPNSNIAVRLQAEHFCVKWRGVQQPSTYSTTHVSTDKTGWEPHLFSELNRS